MSGHSKWATTKRQKAVVDAKRGALFTKIGNQIAIAARGGTDPNMNPSLAMVLEKARLAKRAPCVGARGSGVQAWPLLWWLAQPVPNPALRPPPQTSPRPLLRSHASDWCPLPQPQLRPSLSSSDTQSCLC